MPNYKTLCPNCGGNNYAVAEEKGFAYCFNCTHTEKLDSSYKRVEVKRSKRVKDIRAYYGELVSYYHSCLTTEHRLWLYRRGVSDYSINSLKLGYCPDSDHMLYRADIATEAGVFYKGHIQLKDRIVFPFYANGEVTDLSGRTLDPNNDKKYLHLFGGAWRRGADYAYCHDYAYKPSAYKRVVRTEGLLKAVLSNQYGVPCIAYPGTRSIRSGTTAMQEQVQVICFDNQLNHRRELIGAIKAEVDRHTLVKIATLPLKGKTKQDIDSFILEYGIEEYLRVVDGALDFETWKQLVR